MMRLNCRPLNRRRQAFLLTVALAGLSLSAWWFWPRVVYHYHGKTVEQWFAEVDWTPPSVDPNTGLPVGHDDPAANAFREMGTNGAPFLASLITQSQET